MIDDPLGGGDHITGCRDAFVVDHIQRDQLRVRRGANVTVSVADENRADERSVAVPVARGVGREVAQVNLRNEQAVRQIWDAVVGARGARLRWPTQRCAFPLRYGQSWMFGRSS
jgi:hypothetical protein